MVQTQGVVVDTDTRRKKQQALMTELLERKIRLHAQHLYDERGQADGQALNDWVQAESQVLENTSLASLYRKNRVAAPGIEIDDATPQFAGQDSSVSEACS
jgi:hypothetical protein